MKSQYCHKGNWLSRPPPAPTWPPSPPRGTPTSALQVTATAAGSPRSTFQGFLCTTRLSSCAGVAEDAFGISQGRPSGRGRTSSHVHGGGGTGQCQHLQREEVSRAPEMASGERCLPQRHQREAEFCDSWGGGSSPTKGSRESWGAISDSIPLRHCTALHSLPSRPVSPQAPGRCKHPTCSSAGQQGQLQVPSLQPVLKSLDQLHLSPLSAGTALHCSGSEVVFQFLTEHGCGCRRAGGGQARSPHALCCRALCSHTSAAAVQSEPVPQPHGAAGPSLCQRLAASVPGSQLSVDMPAHESFPAQRERALAQWNFALTFTTVQKGLVIVHLCASHRQRQVEPSLCIFPFHNGGKIFSSQGCSEA